MQRNVAAIDVFLSAPIPCPGTYPPTISAEWFCIKISGGKGSGEMEGEVLEPMELHHKINK